jgi:hypothetical protein
MSKTGRPFKQLIYDETSNLLTALIKTYYE